MRPAGRYRRRKSAQRTVVNQRLERMDHELDRRQFIASDRFTIADITAPVAIDFGSVRLISSSLLPQGAAIPTVQCCAADHSFSEGQV
jgi:glutathione S-transferase